MQFETSFNTLFFENPAASPSLDRSEPPHEKHSTLKVTSDCGYESIQGFGAALPRKEPIWLPLRDSAKTPSPQTLPFVGSRQTRGRPRRQNLLRNISRKNHYSFKTLNLADGVHCNSIPGTINFCKILILNFPEKFYPSRLYCPRQNFIIF